MRFILTLLLALMPVFTWAYQEKTPPQSQPAIDLCDFEVADYHTYFVGKSGVWVHNTGATCEELFSVYENFLLKAGSTPKTAYQSLITRLPNVAETFLPRAYRRMGADVKALGGSFDLASAQRRTHILYGDATGGGHLFPGTLGKSVFPENWDADKVMSEVSELVIDQNIEWRQATGVAGANYTRAGNAIRWVVDGQRDGVNIRVIIEPRGEGIITAFPLN